jgi:glucosamine-6-phosphate deaminase
LILEHRAGKLLVKVFETARELGDVAATEGVAALNEVIEKKGECNVIFAAAPSQNEFLAALCNSSVDWSKINAFHMDEYIGLSADAPQGFGNFLKDKIFNKVPFKSVMLINGQADSIDDEINRYSRLIQQNPPDIVFMGIGENGHIAFNDPHVAHFDDTMTVRKVELDEKCRQQQVNDGCFESLHQVPTHALTLTIPALTSASRIFCMVPYKTKTQAVTKTVLGEIRETLPASILRLHPNAILYIDKDSGRDVIKALGNN